jgi:hypothetical protein
MRSPVCFAALGALLTCVSITSAQMIEVRQINGKSVWCSHSGSFSDGDCAGKPDWYAYVFVGSISSIAPADNDEKELQIVPEEVFHGNPGSPLTVLTSQGLCFPKMQVGDRWLFFLRKQEGKPIVLDYYGNDSRPVADAPRQIDVLRRLRTVGDSGIIRGRVVQQYSEKEAPVPQASIKAQLQSDGRQFVATSDADGYYEFQPLPPGRYNFSVDPIQGLRFDDGAPGSWPVHPGSCWDLNIVSFPHAQLGGHVRRVNGSPVSRAEVIIRRVNDDSRLTTAYTDNDGHYSVNHLQPGDYVVGMNLPRKPASHDAKPTAIGVLIPSASLYYRDAPNISAAMTIQLADGDKRDNIDFVLPDSPDQ